MFLWTSWSPALGLAVGTPIVVVFCYGILPLSMALWTAIEYLSDVASGEWWAQPRTESRFITFGLSSAGRLLVVSHTDEEDVIRIISARPAARQERRIYEEG